MKKNKTIIFALIVVMLLSMSFFSGCDKDTATQPGNVVTPNDNQEDVTHEGGEGTEVEGELTCTIYISCAVLLDNM